MATRRNQTHVQIRNKKLKEIMSTKKNTLHDVREFARSIIPNFQILRADELRSAIVCKIVELKWSVRYVEARFSNIANNLTVDDVDMTESDQFVPTETNNTELENMKRRIDDNAAGIVNISANNAETATMTRENQVKIKALSDQVAVSVDVTKELMISIKQHQETTIKQNDVLIKKMDQDAKNTEKMFECLNRKRQSRSKNDFNPNTDWGYGSTNSINIRKTRPDKRKKSNYTFRTSNSTPSYYRRF